MKNLRWRFNFYSFALGFVFLVFGIWQILNPNYWSAYLPLFLRNFDPNLLFRINGVFNLIVGFSLILNIYPLIFSLLASFHLIGVIFSIGLFNEIAIRDLGLLLLAIAIFIDNYKRVK
ncbi:MAG: hypothetical protein C4347_01735 [Patescibacteria group bacterium]